MGKELKLAVATVTFLFIASLGITAQGLRETSADEIAASGTFDGQLYTNRSLGLTILAPGGWSFYPYSRNQALVAANRSGSRDRSAANTQVLFQSTPSKLSGGESSALFSSGLEKLGKMQTAEQYATANRDMLLTQPGIAVARNIYEAKLGGLTFSGFEITGKAKDLAYRQVYLVTVRKGVAIFFVETFYDNRNTFAVEASLKTLRFGK